MANLGTVGQRVGQACLDLLYPPHCAFCYGEASGLICTTCAGAAPRLDGVCCEGCGLPFEGAIEGSFRCPACREAPHAFDTAVIPYWSRGVVRKAIHGFKYERQYHLRHLLSRWLLETLGDPRVTSRCFTGVLAVPLHPVRQRDRGFNQSEIVAAPLARSLGLPLLQPLVRTRATSTQTRLNRRARSENLRNAFELRQNSRVSDDHLLLVDDVLTTGATVNACARVLRRAGAASVTVLAIAHG